MLKPVTVAKLPAWFAWIQVAPPRNSKGVRAPAIGLDRITENCNCTPAYYDAGLESQKFEGLEM